MEGVVVLALLSKQQYDGNKKSSEEHVAILLGLYSIG
jgi:hypothetical protein